MKTLIAPEINRVHSGPRKSGLPPHLPPLTTDSHARPGLTELERTDTDEPADRQTEGTEKTTTEKERNSLLPSSVSGYMYGVFYGVLWNAGIDHASRRCQSNRSCDPSEKRRRVDAMTAAALRIRRQQRCERTNDDGIKLQRLRQQQTPLYAG